jgi:hypothetical protein
LTFGPRPRSRILVVGVDPEGAEVACVGLGHGDDPNVLLAVRGWDVVRVRDVLRHPVDRHVLTMTFVVESALPLAHRDTHSTSKAQSPGDHAMSKRDNQGTVGGDGPGGAVALRHQRLAAYAVVTSSRGLLMT